MRIVHVGTMILGALAVAAVKAKAPQAAKPAAEVVCGVDAVSNQQKCTDLKTPTVLQDSLPSQQAHPAPTDEETSRLRQMIQKMRTSDVPPPAVEPEARDNAIDGESEDEAPSLWN